MYISNIHIENIRCFKNIDISFEDKGFPLLWNVILGDNSSGKTCLLRCIAIGVCDETSGAALMKELEGDFLKDNNKAGKIRIILKDNSCQYIIETKIVLENGREKIIQHIDSKDNSFKEKLFICGYGIQRSGSGGESKTHYSPLESLYTLFNYYASLQNPELILLRQSRALADKILKKIMAILMFDDDNYTFDLTPRGIEIVGKDNKVLLGSWGDGYASTFTWLTDFFGWQIYANRLNNSKQINDLEGIVLLDEIELNLHPSWQRNIVHLLSSQFPKIQFITTSHSPLCVIGMTDLKDKDCQIILLKDIDGTLEPFGSKPLRGRRTDQILTSYLFGLTSTSDDRTRNEIETYSNLLSKKLTSKTEREQILKLEKILDKKLGTEETDLQKYVVDAVHKTLQKLPNRKEFKKRVLDYEIKNQLRKLMGYNLSNDKDQF